MATEDPTALTLALYRAMTAFDRAEAAALAPHRLTVSQLNILTVLHQADRPLTMGELGQAVSVRPANPHRRGRRADPPVADGAADQPVRRSYLITPTPAGLQFLADFLPEHRRHLDQLLGGLTEADRVALAGLLERLRRSVDDAGEMTGIAG